MIIVITETIALTVINQHHWINFKSSTFAVLYPI